MSLMKVDVRVGETIRFSGAGKIAVTLERKSGKLARLEINADEAVDIQLPSRASVRDVVGEGLTVKKSK